MAQPTRWVKWLSITWLIAANVPAHAQVKSRLAVGVILPLSGSMGAFGAEVMRGIEFAMAELKDKDADLANRIDINTEDSQSQTKLSESLARKLVATRKADILFGALTASLTYNLAKISTEVQRPLVVPTASYPGISAIGPNVFRSCASDEDQGRALAKYGLGSLQKKQAAIIFDKNSTYGRSIAGLFEKTWTAGGGKIVFKREFEGTPNFRELSRQARKADADIMLAPINYPEAAKLMDASKEEGARYKILGSDSWDSPNLWNIANKSSVKGHFFTTQFSPLDNNPDSLAFVGAFQSKYKVPPSLLSAQGYDGMQVVFEAFRRSRSNLTNALLKALPTIANLPGSSGLISIDAQRNAKKPWKIMTTATSGASFVGRVEDNE